LIARISSWKAIRADLEIGYNLAKSPLGNSSFSSLIGIGSGVFGSVVDALLSREGKDMVENEEQTLGSYIGLDENAFVLLISGI
jgi:hypothetical protein